MSHPLSTAIAKPVPTLLNPPKQIPSTKDMEARKAIQKVNNISNLNHLNKINEDFCKLAQESRRRSSKERLKMLQKISQTSNLMHFQQLSGSATVGAIACVLSFQGRAKTCSLFENTTSRVLSSLSSHHQTHVRELEIWYQAEQERIARSRDEERAHMQKWEQHLQSEHSSKLRFFS